MTPPLTVTETRNMCWTWEFAFCVRRFFEKNPDLHMGPENEIIIPVLEMEWYEWETEVSPGGKRLGTA